MSAREKQVDNIIPAAITCLCTWMDKVPESETWWLTPRLQVCLFLHII